MASAFGIFNEANSFIAIIKLLKPRYTKRFSLRVYFEGYCVEYQWRFGVLNLEVQLISTPLAGTVINFS